MGWINAGKDGVIFLNCFKWLGKLIWKIKH